MWESGDLSLASNPYSYDYIHRYKDNINLSLSVINQMTVNTDFFVEPFVSKFVITKKLHSCVYFCSISEIIIGPSFM